MNSLEEYMDLKIGVDTPFRFHCTQCGDCCINRDDIILTAKDLFFIAQKLGSTPQETAKQNCEVYIGNTSRIPIIRLAPKGLLRHCPFLKDNKCAVHDVKPTVCATFPIGRMIELSPNKCGDTSSEGSRIEYVFVNPSCGDHSETHTVREWLGRFGMDLEDPFFITWYETISELSMLLRKAEECTDIERMEKLRAAVFYYLYLDYDVTQDFYVQFQSNTTVFMNVLKMYLQEADADGQEVSTPSDSGEKEIMHTSL